MSFLALTWDLYIPMLLCFNVSCTTALAGNSFIFTQPFDTVTLALFDSFQRVSFNSKEIPADSFKKNINYSENWRIEQS